MFSKCMALSVSLAAALVPTLSAHALELTSTTVFEGEQLTDRHVFEGFGCEGENQSPQLSWTAAPEGTKSFAVTVYDPDAPTGSGWWHWNVVNIPASVTEIAQNASMDNNLPEGASEIRNDYGVVGFGGACPPPGEVHRYVVTIYALGTERLDLPDNPSNALVGFMIRANMLASDTITAVYHR